MLRHWIALAFGLLLGTTGCGPQERTYQVIVRNDSAEPVTMDLVKDGPPAEGPWASPEELAQVTRADSIRWGQGLPAGKTAESEPKRGRFDRGTNAVLRIYAGLPTMTEMLAISRGSMDRVDLVLPPGTSTIVVEDQSGRLTARVVEGAGKTSSR